jgi:Putative peptidoglycan binding domain
MTLRRGMSGAAVQRVEEFLSSLKLYRGIVDGSFGGGVESAVKTYQNQQGLAPSGLVDPGTWSHMFPGVPPPVSEVASRPLAERCLALTGSFETGKYPPDCFCGITGDFDQMGLSFGALQWNLGQGTLQPLLMQMFDQHADVARDIFHEHFDTVASLRSAALPDQLAFTRSVQNRSMLQEPWQGMLTALGRTPEFQFIQTDHAARIFQQGLKMCGDYGLVSERAAALMFDIATQGGSISTIVRAQILADFSHLQVNAPDTEVAKMCIVANRRAAASLPQYVDDVRTRKLTVANGSGVVHGIFYDLADMFGLTLNPYAQALAAAQ